jgi:hypothetical protein
MLRVSTLRCMMRDQGLNRVPCCLDVDVAENNAAVPATANIALTGRGQVCGASADRLNSRSIL